MTTTPQRSASHRSGYSDRIVTHPPEWHWLVVVDMLLNNLATGLFLVAATAELLQPAMFRTVSAWAYPVALVFLSGDLLCLVFDLGDPLRFHHMLRVFKPTSPMSLGTWSLTAFSLPLTVIVALDFLGLMGIFSRDAAWMRWAHEIAVILGVIPAFASVAYKGVLFSTTAQPGWKDARWLGAYLMNSAIMLGAAVMLVISTIVGEIATDQTLRVAVGLLLGLNLIPFSLLLLELMPTLLIAMGRTTVMGAVAGLILVGVIVPVGLLMLGGNPIVAACMIVALVSAGLAIRAGLVWLPHLVEAATPSR